MKRLSSLQNAACVQLQDSLAMTAKNKQIFVSTPNIANPKTDLFCFITAFIRSQKKMKK